MMTVMIVLAVIYGILSVLFVALCCYLCARRNYIKVCLDSASYPLRDSEMIGIVQHSLCRQTCGLNCFHQSEGRRPLQSRFSRRYTLAPLRYIPSQKS